VWFWPDRSGFVEWFVPVDKWLHATTFVVLAVWFAGQYRRNSYWRIGVGLLFFGALIEACQGLVAYRSADWLDIAANAAGIAVGMAVAMAGLGGWSLWIENRLAGNKAEASGD
jgi:VanZ family protein